MKEFETSTRAVLDALNVDLVTVGEFGCCGHPLKSVDYRAAIAASARNIALAESRGLTLLTLCSCCYGNLVNARGILSASVKMRDKVNQALAREKLEYQGNGKVRHVFEALALDIGLERLNARLVRRFHGLKVAPQYGCHLLRPVQTAPSGQAADPALFDRLLEVLGAESVAWPTGRECCGAPALGVQDDVSLKMRERKVGSAAEAGIDIIGAACPFCYLQLNGGNGRRKDADRPYAALFTKMLGLCLGISPKKLGVSPETKPEDAKMLAALR